MIVKLHTLKFIAEGANVLIVGKPCTGKGHQAKAKAIAYQLTLQGHDMRYLEADTEFARYVVTTGSKRSLLASPSAPSRPNPADLGLVNLGWPQVGEYGLAIGVKRKLRGSIAVVSD